MSIFGNTGKLTIENGTFENNGQESMSFVVDNRAGYNGGNAELIINGGTLSCPIYTAVRLLQQTPDAYVEEQKCFVKINGGNISGKRCFYLQHYSDGKGYGILTLNGGKMNATQRFAQIDVSGLVTNTTQIDITGGEISIDATTGDAVFHVDTVYASSPVDESVKVTVTGSSAKVMANGHKLFNPVDGKDNALAGEISGGIFDIMPEKKYIVEGHESDIKIGGSSEVKYERAFLYTVTIPTVFDFGSNLDMENQVSINFVTQDAAKKVTMKVSSTNSFALKFGEVSLPYTIKTDSKEGTQIEEDVVFFEPVASETGTKDKGLFFHLTEQPSVAGTYTDALTFTTEVVDA